MACGALPENRKTTKNICTRCIADAAKRRHTTPLLKTTQELPLGNVGRRLGRANQKVFNLGDNGQPLL